MGEGGTGGEGGWLVEGGGGVEAEKDREKEGERIRRQNKNAEAVGESRTSVYTQRVSSHKFRSVCQLGTQAEKELGPTSNEANFEHGLLPVAQIYVPLPGCINKMTKDSQACFTILWSGVPLRFESRPRIM